MTKRKAEDALGPASIPCPAQRNGYVHPAMGLPPVIHCQPATNVGQFANCMLGRCNHCVGCLECQTHVQLTWQKDHHLRTKLGSYSAALRARAEVYDRIAPSFTRDHEAHDQIFLLQDQLQALQEQMNQIQQTLPMNTPGHSMENEIAQHDNPNNDEERSPGGVRKYENEVEDSHAVSNFDPSLPDDHDDAGAEASDERYDTAQSTCNDEEDGIVLKREETPVDEFALIDQIPSSGQYRRQQAMVVIDVEEQVEARRSLEQVQQRESHDKRAVQREQPVRETALRTPRPSIEDTRQTTSGSAWSAKPISGSAWTEREDKKLLKGAKKKLSNREIHERYLPNRTTEAVKKRRQKLAKN